MKLRLFILLTLACSTRAGPIVLAVAAVAGDILGDAGAAAVYASSIADACGIAPGMIFFGKYILIDGALFWGSGFAPAGALALAGGVAGGGYEGK